MAGIGLVDLSSSENTREEDVQSTSKSLRLLYGFTFHISYGFFLFLLDGFFLFLLEIFWC